MTPLLPAARRALFGLIILLVPAAAQAHIVAARLGDFYTGALHPLTDLQDAVLWLALGLFAGSLGPRQARWLLLVMPAGLLTGFALIELLGLAGSDSGGPGAAGIAHASALAAAGLMVLVGLLLASGLRAGLRTLLLLAGVVALASGASNAAAMAPASNAPLFAAGLISAGYVALTLVMALTVQWRGSAPWRGVALRVCGSWIAAIGLMLGGFALKASLA